MVTATKVYLFGNTSLGCATCAEISGSILVPLEGVLVGLDDHCPVGTTACDRGYSTTKSSMLSCWKPVFGLVFDRIDSYRSLPSGGALYGIDDDGQTSRSRRSGHR